MVGWCVDGYRVASTLPELRSGCAQHDRDTVCVWGGTPWLRYCLCLGRNSLAFTSWLAGASMAIGLLRLRRNFVPAALSMTEILFVFGAELPGFHIMVGRCVDGYRVASTPPELRSGCAQHDRDTVCVWGGTPWLSHHGWQVRRWL